METQIETITINGIEYVRKSDVEQRTVPGKRAIIVVDRGWIVAGDVTEEDGRIRLTRAVHVFGWKYCGFAGIVTDSTKADLRPLADGFDMPSDAEIFRQWVPDNWGAR